MKKPSIAPTYLIKSALLLAILMLPIFSAAPTQERAHAIAGQVFQEAKKTTE